VVAQEEAEAGESMATNLEVAHTIRETELLKSRLSETK